MLGRKSRMTKLVIISAIVLGFLLPASVISSSDNVEETEFLRIRVDDAQQLDAMEARGTEIVADYTNGYVLAKVGTGQSSYLDRYFDVERMNELRSIDITFAGLSITPGREMPKIPNDLTYKRATDEYIVQFAGPMKQEWTNAIMDLGGEIYFYYQFYSMLIKIPPSRISAVKNLPFVNWIGNYQPAYKVASELWDSEGGQLMTVHAYNNVDTVEFANKLDSIGATVMMSSSSPTIVLVHADSSIISDIAALPDVKAIFPESVKQQMDSVAGEIHKFHYAWYPTWSGLPAPPTSGPAGTVLTGRLPGANGTLYDDDDEFEIGGVVDSGFDVKDANDGHIDFFDSPNGDRIVEYYDASQWAKDNPDGWGVQCEPHGTACVGIMASDGYAWETSPHEGVHSTTDKEWHESEAGVAPEAKMTVAGVPGNYGLGILGWYSYLGSQCVDKPCWDRMYLDDGARTISNSWGGTGPYNSYVDERIDKWNDLMIVFAAGNDGPSPNTISEPGAKSKNGLSIGASQNYRPDYFGADNHNLMADFSSRGGDLVSSGRIKPDVVAIGTAGITTMGPYGYRCNRDSMIWGQGVPQPDYIMEVDEYNHTTKAPGADGINDYRYFSGTSQASPMAAGNYMLIREYIREIAGLPYANSSLAKALLINGAVRMSEELYDYPGWDQGWGRVNIQESLFPTPPRTNQFVEGWFNNTGNCDLGAGTCSDPVNSTLTGTLNTNVASSATPLKVTLVWIDSPIGENLVRDLNLRVISPSGVEYRGNAYNLTGTYKGWSAPNPATAGVDNPKWLFWWSSPAGWDYLNTVEQIEVEFPEPGNWTVEVDAPNIPLEFANFSVVFAADIGPQTNYKVDLSSNYPPTVSVALGGTVSYPFTVTNYGSNTDTIDLVSLSPSLSVGFDPESPYTLDSLESQASVALITAPLVGLAPGIYKVKWEGISQGDNDVRDFIEITVEVLASPIPSPIQITTETTNDVDPSVLVFDDGTDKHIFIAYIKTVPLSGWYGGENIWMAHTTLDENGMPIEPWDYRLVSAWNDFPTDIRFKYLPSGTKAGRVLITWTGYDPQWGVDQMWYPWSKIAYSDPPYDTWTNSTIDFNGGGATVNAKRVSFTLYRETTEELLYVWETLGSSSPEDNPSIVETWYKISTDGGENWGPNSKLFPPPGPNMFYFFPTGCVDQNDVVWIVVYFRLPAGNDRDLRITLYDGTWSSTPPMIWDTTDNVQFPACLSTNEGPAGNRMYFAVTRDLNGADFTIWMSYTDGNYSSGSPPAGAVDISPIEKFSPSFDLVGDANGRSGPGRMGPYTVSLSDANYNRGPLMVLLNTTEQDDQRIWLTYMENSHLAVPPWPANPYGVPNIWTLHSNDTFASLDVLRVTADAFAKGHRMADALQVSGQGMIYETFHSNKGGLGAVDYNVYLTIYTQDWDTKPDILGPITSNVYAIPNPFNISSDTSFELTANINDLVTGMNNISEAQYTETSTLISDPLDVEWGISIPMMLSFQWPGGGDPTPSEIANATIAPIAWLPGEVHRLWVRGKDAIGNWGKGAYIDVHVVGGAGAPPGAPTLTSVELINGNADVKLTWTLSSNDGDIGFEGYEVYAGNYYSTGRLGYELKTPTILIPGSFEWTHSGAGISDPNNYYYVVVAKNTSGLRNASPNQGAKMSTYYTAGKHLMSIPLELSTNDLPTLLSTMDYNIAWWYDPMDLVDPWKFYHPSKTYNDLSTYNGTMGLWVEAASDTYHTIAGMISIAPTAIVLKAGWNLIGYPTLVSRDVGTVFSLISGPLRVEGYDPMNPPENLMLMEDTDLMTPTYGYWVKVDMDQTVFI